MLTDEKFIDDPKRAVQLGLGAASPLWPTFIAAAGAGVAFWAWTQWMRGKAQHEFMGALETAQPAATKMVAPVSTFPPIDTDEAAKIAEEVEAEASVAANDVPKAVVEATTETAAHAERLAHEAAAVLMEASPAPAPAKAEAPKAEAPKAISPEPLMAETLAPIAPKAVAQPAPDVAPKSPQPKPVATAAPTPPVERPKPKAEAPNPSIAKAATLERPAPKVEAPKPAVARAEISARPAPKPTPKPAAVASARTVGPRGAKPPSPPKPARPARPPARPKG